MKTTLVFFLLCYHFFLDNPVLSQKNNYVLKSQRPTFTVIVDGAKTLEEMIREGGYSQLNKAITEKNFPIREKTKRTVVIALFFFNRKISSNEAISEMNKEGYRPATHDELIALGAKRYGLKEKFPIVALGSVWANYPGPRKVCLLYWNSYSLESGLDLDWIDSDLHDDFRVAAVHK